MSPLAATGALVVIAVWGGARMAAPRGRHGRTGRWPHDRRTPSPTCDNWAELLDAVAAEVRSGSSLTAALAAAQRRSPTYGTVVRPGCHLPFPPTAVLSNDEAVAVQALSAAHTLGGPTAATLHSGAALLRERAAIRGEAQAHSAQARLSARVLTAVPLLFAAWSLTTSGSFRAAVVSPIGVVSVLLGWVCNLIGWWWMRRIVRQAAA